MRWRKSTYRVPACLDEERHQTLGGIYSAGIRLQILVCIFLIPHLFNVALILITKDRSTYRVKGVEANAEYRLGVMAKNKAGLSQPTVTREYVQPHEKPASPEIEITTPLVNGSVVINAPEEILLQAKVWIFYGYSSILDILSYISKFLDIR